MFRRLLGLLLHPARRRAAIHRLCTRRDGLRSVLFVCHGNICRSPYAAGAFRQILAEESSPPVEVWSAGFLGSGRPATPMAVAAAARRGVDLGAHRSEQIGAERVRAADLVVVMDAFQEREIRLRFGKRRHAVLILADLLLAFGDARVIPDPIDQPLETFEWVYTQIDQCLAALRSALTPGTCPDDLG